MAIIIEERRNRVSLVSVVTWVVALIIIVVTVYYLFFQNPEKTQTVLPQGFETTKRVNEIYRDPKTITQDPLFRERQEYVPPPVPGVKGRENPFIPTSPLYVLPPLPTSTASST